MRKDRGGGGFIAGVPIWNSEFKFEMKWAGYLLAVIPGWSVLAETIRNINGDQAASRQRQKK
jgi:hypothetical protein